MRAVVQAADAQVQRITGGNDRGLAALGPVGERVRRDRQAVTVNPACAVVVKTAGVDTDVDAVDKARVVQRVGLEPQRVAGERAPVLQRARGDTQLRGPRLAEVEQAVGRERQAGRLEAGRAEDQATLHVQCNALAGHPAPIRGVVPEQACLQAAAGIHLAVGVVQHLRLQANVTTCRNEAALVRHGAGDQRQVALIRAENAALVEQSATQRELQQTRTGLAQQTATVVNAPGGNKDARRFDPGASGDQRVADRKRERAARQQVGAGQVEVTLA